MANQAVNATCGIAKLLAATFGTTLTEVFPQVGLELCPQCGSASNNPPTYPFCNQKHYDQFNRAATAIPLICDECEIFFVRRESEVMQWAKRGGQKIYCSHACNGAYNGRTFGTPVNTAIAVVRAKGRGTHCKRGHEMTPKNTYDYRKTRACKTCHQLRYHTRKAAEPSGI